MRKIGLIVAGLILATAGTGAWASSANAGEPEKRWQTPAVSVGTA